jgi:hypothetical protein
MIISKQHTMQKHFFTITISLLLLTSCGDSTKTNPESTNTETTVTAKDATFENALTFINGYVDNCNKIQEAIGAIDWVNSNALATASFKTELKKMMDEATEKDPEMGLGADPLFDAQDYPEKGFELESFDEKTNYLTVKGKEWPDFKLTMKVIEENGNWLIDGCGMVNIPSDKKAKR